MLSTDALDALLHLSIFTRFTSFVTGLNIEYGVGFIEKYESTKPIKWNKNISTGKWSPY